MDGKAVDEQLRQPPQPADDGPQLLPLINANLRATAPELFAGWRMGYDQAYELYVTADAPRVQAIIDAAVRTVREAHGPSHPPPTVRVVVAHTRTHTDAELRRVHQSIGGRLRELGFRITSSGPDSLKDRVIVEVEGLTVEIKGQLEREFGADTVEIMESRGRWVAYVNL